MEPTSDEHNSGQSRRINRMSDLTTGDILYPVADEPISHVFFYINHQITTIKYSKTIYYQKLTEQNFQRQITQLMIPKK